jgi:hypothetical protein
MTCAAGAVATGPADSAVIRHKSHELSNSVQHRPANRLMQYAAKRRVSPPTTLEKGKKMSAPLPNSPSLSPRNLPLQSNPQPKSNEVADEKDEKQAESQAPGTDNGLGNINETPPSTPKAEFIDTNGWNFDAFFEEVAQTPQNPEIDIPDSSDQGPIPSNNYIDAGVPAPIFDDQNKAVVEFKSKPEFNSYKYLAPLAPHLNGMFFTILAQSSPGNMVLEFQLEQELDIVADKLSKLSMEIDEFLGSADDDDRLAASRYADDLFSLNEMFTTVQNDSNDDIVFAVVCSIHKLINKIVERQSQHKQNDE